MSLFSQFLWLFELVNVIASKQGAESTSPVHQSYLAYRAAFTETSSYILSINALSRILTNSHHFHFPALDLHFTPAGLESCLNLEIDRLVFKQACERAKRGIKSAHPAYQGSFILLMSDQNVDTTRAG